jgi:hypothetical protein
MSCMNTSTYIKKVIRQGAMLLPFVVIYKAAITEYLEYKTYKYIIIYDIKQQLSLLLCYLSISVTKSLGGIHHK